MSLAEELLDAARAAAPQTQSWVERLSPEHRRAVVEARDSWRRAGGHMGISAAVLAKTIIHKLTALGYDLPKPKQVATWLNHSAD